MKITDQEDADRCNHRAARGPRPRTVKPGGRLREHGDGSGAQLAACYSRALAIRGKLRPIRPASREQISAPPEVLREWLREELALLQRMTRPGE